MASPRPESPETETRFDAVVCVGPHKVHMAKLAIKSLQYYARPRRIYLLASSKFFPELQLLAHDGCPVILLDEDKFIEGVDLPGLERYFIQRTGRPFGTGWYLQQFLKMGAARIPDVAEHYLIWDSDTIMLQSVEFFDAKGRVQVSPKDEHHHPYFELTEQLLGFGRAVPFSFISEHFMVKTRYMLELLQAIESRAPAGKNWVYTILDQITVENLKNSGFSEFETYGNFVQTRYPESYFCRPLKSSRNGATLFGMRPSKPDIYYLMKQGYCFISFERWNRKKGWKVLPSKIRSASVYAVERVLGKFSRRNRNALEVVAALCD